ncbi:MAG: hypothetical protein IKJ27_09650, partial [Clostridia bacterium]|nr:hypothetical protein [Clostridia bacterium]
AIFCGADFWQDKTQNAVNPIGFTSILTKYWRKSARKKRGSDYARHPMLTYLIVVDFLFIYQSDFRGQRLSFFAHDGAWLPATGY